MKKKVFSLMMTLLLAFMGVAKADVVTIGEGTGTTYYFPIDNYFNYSCTEQIYLASEVGTAGTINAISFYYNYGTAYTANNVTMYMKNVSRSSFSANTDYEPLALGDIVWTGAISPTASGWYTFTLDTPFEYDGSSNLLVAFFDGTSGYPGTSYTWRQTTSPSSANMALRYYSDSSCPDPYNLGSYGGSKMLYTYRANVQIDITPGGGGGATFTDKLHVKYVNADGDEVIDSLNLGVRPVGAWMEPFEFTMYSEGPTYNVTVLDFTPSDGMFSVEGEELPFQVTSANDVDLVMATNATAAGVVERQFVAITEGNRAAHIWPVIVEMYDPEIPDVVERAYDFGDVDHTFTYQGVPADITPTELHNDYTLPFPEIPEGVDAVYKLNFTEDVMLDAYVSAGEDGKVALYTEDFYGEGGPMANNYYQGPSVGGGGGASAPFEAQIGEGTSTSGYFPFYSLYNYSISAELFLAAELEEAGVTTAPFTSLSWNATNSITQDQNNITIWMANVTDTQIPTTSPLASGMTKVYTGNLTQPTPTGWVEFVFNEGSFAWDGHSNVMILCQRNNGSWTSSIQWQYHNPGFQARGYDYTDNAAYNVMTTSYSWYTSSTTRANIIMKGGNRASVNAFTYNFEGGVSGWTSIDNDGDGEDWFHSSNSVALSGYDYTGCGNNDSDGFMVSASYCDITGDSFDADNYLVSPQKYSLGTGASLNFFFDYGSDSYPDYFEVCVATANNPGASDFTSIWDVNMRGGNASKTQIRHSNNRYDNWREVTVDLSAYAGQEVWIAFHHEDYDEYELWIDDVTVNTGSGSTPEPPVTGEISFGPEITNAPIQAGTYYLVASSTTPDFEVTINAENMPCPAVEGFAFNPEPADDADGIEPASVTLRWQLPDYATGWRLIFGTTYYPDPNHPQTIIYPENGEFTTELANSYTVTNLWNNTNYFWRVEFNNDGCPDGVSSPVWGFTTHLNVPQNLRANDETIFEDETSP